MMFPQTPKIEVLRPLGAIISSNTIFLSHDQDTVEKTAETALSPQANGGGLSRFQLAIADPGSPDWDIPHEDTCRR